MKEVNLMQAAPQILDKMMHGGVFFTVKDKQGRVNTMNIGWGSVSYYWNRPVFIAPIRHNRYTYALLQDADSFTVSVPLDDSFKAAVAYVGTHHGNEVDKYKEANLSLAPAQAVDGMVIAGHLLTIECKIQLIQPMTTDHMSEEVHTGSYGDEDFHVLYFGQVMKCYEA